MKPPPFDYLAPGSLEEALAVLAERAGRGDEARPLAGGQSLVPLLNFRLSRPAVLVDLNRLPAGELDFVRRDAEGGLRLGAMTRQRRLERDPLVAELAPLLAEAAPSIAHPQIRNRGTLGGSLAHADPAAELPAVAVALEARLRLRRRDGERWLDAAELFAGPLTTVLERDELLVEMAVPPPPARTGWAFAEIARRLGDYAQIGVAARLSLDSLDGAGRCGTVRLVYLSAGDVPLVARRAAELLTGEEPTEDRLGAAAAAAAAEIEPVGDVHASAAFKRHLAGVLAGRVLRRALERAREAREAQEGGAA